MKKLTMKVGLVFVTLFFTIAASAASISQVIAFGDSLSDNGNFFALTGQPPAPYWNGRFSNGPVWVESLASSLGVGLDGYAYGGASTGGAGVLLPSFANTNGPFPGLQDQIATYLGTVGGVADPNGLYTVWAGANDILGSPGNEINAIGPAVANLLTAITALQAAGAVHFIVPNLPDLGLTPQSIAGGPAAMAGGTAIASVFNSLYSQELDAAFGAGFGVRLDTFSLIQQINAGTLGSFANVTEQCVLTANPFDNTVCDTYAFWDAIHPTRVTHDLLAAEAFAQVVPVPAAVWLFGSALGLLGWMRRTR